MTTPAERIAELERQILDRHNQLVSLTDEHERALAKLADTRAALDETTAALAAERTRLPETSGQQCNCVGPAAHDCKHQASQLTAADIADLGEIYDALIDAAAGNQATYAFVDAFGDPILIFVDEDGNLCYSTVPTDDPDDNPVGYVSTARLSWPLTRLVPAASE